MNNLIRGLVSVFCATSITIFQYSSLKKSTISNMDRSVQSDRLSSEQTVRQMEMIKSIPSIGFRNFVANWTFLQFLQYFGDEEGRRVSGYSVSPNYLSTTIAHDPYYKDFYLFLSESTTFYSGMPNVTVEVMEENLLALEESRAPNSYYIWRYKGTDELLFLNDSKAAQQSFEMAAAWAEESGEENSELLAELSQQTADFLASSPDSKQARISAWASILTTSRDERARTRAIQEIRKLGGNVIISDLAE